MRYVVAYRQIVTFADTKHYKTAKEFLNYLLKPQTLGPFLKAASRNLPVMKSFWRDRFWTNPADPHFSVVANVFTQRQTRPFYQAYHPAYSMVLNENVWSQALNRVIVDDVSAEQAADEAIAKIQQIFQQWEMIKNSP
jgi:multiple sugar transport system substrate-binding protein